MKIILIILFGITFSSLHGQQEGITKPKAEAEPAFVIVETMPSFQNAENEVETWANLNRYIKNKIKEDKPKEKGTVYVRFEIDKEGKVSHIEILRAVSIELDGLAKKYFEEMPLWTPGKQRGQNVNVSYTLPVKF